MLAQYYDAEVTGICCTAILELEEQLEADGVIDYTLEDFMEPGDHYDLIFEAVRRMMSGISGSKVKKAFSANGIFVNIEVFYQEKPKDLIFLKHAVLEEWVEVHR